MANIEGEAAKKMASVGGKGGNISPILTGILAGRYFKRDGGNAASKSSKVGRSAADWHNEEVSRRYEFERQGTRRDWARDDSQLPNIKNMSYDTSGSVSFGSYQAPAAVKGPEAKADSPKKETPSGKSGNVKGQQFSGSKGKKGTLKDTRAAVAGGHITAEEAIQISPTYAKKFAEKAAAKEATVAPSVKGPSAKATKASKAPKA